MGTRYSEGPSPYFFFSYLRFIAKRRRVRNEKSVNLKRLSIGEEDNSEPLTKNDVFSTLNTLNVTYPSPTVFFNIQNSVAAMVFTNDYSLSVLHRLQVCQHPLQHLHPLLSAQVCRVVHLQAHRAQVCQPQQQQ